MNRPRVVIVQEYVPNYRVKFFSGLVATLDRRGIDCSVLAGRPSGSQAIRGDAVDQTRWLRNVDARLLKVGSRNVRFYGTDRHWRDDDGLIMELRGTSLDLTAELLKKHRTGRRIGVWGHVKSFTQPANRVDVQIERLQMRRCDHVFAYTHTGARFAINSGVRPEDVTTVVNSIDVDELVLQYERLETAEVDAFLELHGLTPGKTFGYIGGLDASKRIDFLSEALDIMWSRDPTVKLLIGGRGDQEHMLSVAVERGQAIRLGYVDAKIKAMIARTSRALLNPGRVGLLAVECMAMGLPILTTDWPFHAPEYEYLERGVDVFLAPDDVHQFAELVLMRTKSEAVSATERRSHYPSIDGMIGNFADGVTAMMA